MKADKIKKLYSEKFGTELSDEELELLIENDCKCPDCGRSVFELEYEPEIVVKERWVSCEDCYDNAGHRIRCAICEESIDAFRGEEGFWHENKKDASADKRKPGIYKINWIDGDRMPSVENYELLVNIDIELFGNDYKDIRSDWICPECAEKFSKKENYLTVEDAPCILFEKYRAYYKEYSDEQLHEARQEVIHERITNRGIIEQANRGKK